MSYLMHYSYKFNSEGEHSIDGICFDGLFRSLSNKGKIQKLDVSVNMYENPKNNEHKLSFTPEEILYVFSKMSNLFEPPVIEEIKNGKHGEGYVAKFEFVNKTPGYIKTVLTILRYFFENYMRKGIMIDIMRDSIEFSKAHPEESFIEILQVMHFGLHDNSGHSLINMNDDCYCDFIVSEATVAKNLLDPEVLKVYCYVYEDCKSIFGITNLIPTKCSREEYLKTFKEIKRI